MKEQTKKIIKTVVDVILWVFLAFSLTLTIFAFIGNASGKEYPVVNGKCYLCVQSNSMDGDASLYESSSWEINYGFKKGDLILGVSLTDQEKRNLKVGDVITYYHDLDGDGELDLNTHRIVEVLNDGERYQTKGDNNKLNDGYEVYASRIEAKWNGKVVKGAGNIMDFFRSSNGFLFCVVIPLAIFFIYELVVLIMTINKYKATKNPKPTISKEEEEQIKQRAIEEYLAKQAAEKKNQD